MTNLFGRNYFRDTLALWVSFFTCLFAVYTMFSWGPTLLSGVGFGLAVSSSGLTAFNIGGIVGALAGGVIMGRLGSRLTSVTMAAAGAAVAAIIALAPLSSSSATGLVMLELAALGVFVPGLQVLQFALAAQVYPTSVRSTGVGAALATGRLGAVLSAFAGAYVLQFGYRGFFGIIAAAMIVCAAALLLIERHTDRERDVSQTGRRS